MQISFTLPLLCGSGNDVLPMRTAAVRRRAPVNQGVGFPKHHLRLTLPDPEGCPRLKGWRNTVGNLVILFGSTRPITGLSPLAYA